MPAARAIRMAKIQGIPKLVISTAVREEPTAITEPTDRSIPPVRMTMSIPKATRIGPACCRRIFRRFR